MVHVTSLTKGLERLLRICPKLTLDPRAIQLIIDGKQNQVIAEHRNAQKPRKIIVEATVPSISSTRNITINTTTASDNITVDIGTSVTTDEKAFDEYFKD